MRTFPPDLAAHHPRPAAMQQAYHAQRAAILDALPSQVALLDGEGRIVVVNQAWRRFGDAEGLRSPHHGVGLDYVRICEAAGDDKSQQAAQGIRRVLAGELDTFELEYPCHSPTRERWFLMRVVPLEGPGAAGAVVMHVDISDRVRIARDLERFSRETSERERLLNTMLSASPDLTYAIDRRGRLLYANQASLDLWGLTQDQIRGKDTSDLGYPPELSRKIREQFEDVFRNRRTVTGVTSFTGRSGRCAYYEYIFSPALAADGSVDFVVGCSRDITARKQSEQALRESEAQFRTLSSAMPQIVWASGEGGEFTYLNELWQEYTGRSCQESLGRQWLHAVHPDDRQAVLDACCRAAGGDRSSVEVRLARVDGWFRWWLFRSVPVTGLAGQERGCIGTWTDIDELKSAGAEIARTNRKLQLQRNELRTLLDLIPAGIVFKDLQGCVVLLNERAAHEMGLTVKEAVGVRVADVYPDRAARYSQEDEEVIRTGALLVGKPERVIGADGREAWYQSDKVPYRDENGNIAGVIVMKRDITERKQVQDALHELNLHLEARVRERTAALTVAQEEAVRANRAKSTFLATMSHEIRTPMSGLLGLLELLEFTPLDDGQRSTLTLARESGEALKRLVDGILDFSKIESDLLEIDARPASIRDVVDSVCALHSPIARRKNVLLLASVAPQVSAHLLFDDLRVGQMLNNFVGNAIKFTDKGAVTVHVDLLERTASQERLRVTVTDTGIGIAADKIGQLFRPFAQADAHIGSQYGGTGLGLFISRRLAERMGGEVTLDSVEGEGTTVALAVAFDLCDASVARPSSPEPSMLSVSSIAAARRARPTVEEAIARGTLLLVVDDHPINRMLLLRQVCMLGYAAEAAADGVEALKAWDTGRYAAVLTDCNMPGMNGFELARAIRRRESGTGRRMPVIGCTANAMAEAAQACLEAGMDESLTKPVGLQELYAKLARWLPIAEPVEPQAPETLGGTGPLAEPALLDMAHLDLISGGDGETLAAVVRDFRHCNEIDLERLRRAVQAADHSEVRQLAHRICGACATLGAARLANASAAVEAAARTQQPDAIDAALARFDDEWGRLSQLLAKLD